MLHGAGFGIIWRSRQPSYVRSGRSSSQRLPTVDPTDPSFSQATQAVKPGFVMPAATIHIPATEQTIYRCATCGVVSNRHDEALIPHYRYVPRPAVRKESSLTMSACTTLDMVPCGPMVPGRFVPDEATTWYADKLAQARHDQRLQFGDVWDAIRT